MAQGRIQDGAFQAQCEVCGRWQEVEPAPLPAEPFFSHWEAHFDCCQRRQRVRFTLEKDELDFH